MNAVKALTCSLGAIAALTLGAHVASATTLGSVEFNVFVNGNSPYIADLGGVNALPDAMTNLNEYNGAATLPNGLPVGYDVQIDRTFVGDHNTATADGISDKYLFKIDPASLAGDHANATARITLVTGVNTGMDNVQFTFWESDAAGNEVGPQLDSVTGNGSINAELSTSTYYMMKVTGNLRADNAQIAGDQSTNIGRYDLVFASVIPLPPAILLFLTGIGALFGFRGMRRRESATA